jgi:hypothetical protein
MSPDRRLRDTGASCQIWNTLVDNSGRRVKAEENALLFVGRYAHASARWLNSHFGESVSPRRGGC